MLDQFRCQQKKHPRTLLCRTIALMSRYFYTSVGKHSHALALLNTASNMITLWQLDKHIKVMNKELLERLGLRCRTIESSLCVQKVGRSNHSGNNSILKL